MIADSTNSVTAARPTSTHAQTVTACATALVAVVLIATVTFSWFYVSTIDERVSDDAPSAVTQWLCLPYTDFVLDQHRAGLTSEQIAAALGVSEYGDRGQLGVTTPDPEITAPRLDSTDSCGLPFEILAAVDQLTPAGAPSP
ncbi:MAG: hypothetical protein DI630_00205 [Gordonia sp. (in: high G+C Gram-positive bacteria)]|nr:MAG: hypothetical protein DI630_00205 [Gordonia sp. (in: high G+C Gram-positive bacteria)]